MILQQLLRGITNLGKLGLLDYVGLLASPVGVLKGISEM